MTTYTLRPELPQLPDRMKGLQLDERGYPVPWFVAWVDGKPDFRVIEPSKITRAVRERRCWVCGETLGKWLAFVIGPMCAINRVSSEPPSHRECAEFSAKACPFLTRPHMVRRENDLPDHRDSAGHGLRRNPGVTLLWITRSYKIERIPQSQHANGGVLFFVGDPVEVICYAEGRLATSDETRKSVDGGYPLLLEAAQLDGAPAIAQLEKQTAEARRLLGIEP